MVAFARTLAKAVVSQVEAVLSRTSLAAGTPFDITEYEGTMVFVAAVGAPTAGSSQTLDLKLQHSDTSGGTYTDISGAAFQQVTTTAAVRSIQVDCDRVRAFVRVVATFGGTTPTYPFGVQAIGLKKYS